jgi:hypothetical protein
MIIMNRLDKKQIFLLIIFFIILLPQYPSFFKSSFNKALAQSSNYTKFTTPYGGFIFRYSYPNIVKEGGWVYVDDYNNGRTVKYTITLIPYEIDRNNNLSFWLNFYIKDSLINPKPGVDTSYAYRNIYFSLEPKYLGKLKQEYLNKKYILIPSNVDLNELKALADREGKYRKWWYVYEIFDLILIDSESLFCDKDWLQRDCGYLKDSGYATDTVLSRSSYWDYYYGGSDKYITFKVETIKNPLAAVLAKTPTSTSSPNQAATLRYLFSKLGYIDTPHDYYILDLDYDPSDLEEDLKNNLKTKLILFKTFLPKNLFIVGTDRYHLNPIFIQTPTSGSPLAMAATKEYVDKMCFGGGQYFSGDSSPSGKSMKFNPSNNQGIYFKNKNNSFAPLFLGNYNVPIYDPAVGGTKLFRDKVVNKYEVDNMCKNLEWNTNLYIYSGYFKVDAEFSPAAYSHIPNSPPDPIYDLQNYKLFFYGNYGNYATSVEITLPSTTTRITLWYPTIGRYSNISAGITANYFSGHSASYATSISGYLLKLTPAPQIYIKQIDIYLSNCRNGRNYSKRFINQSIPFLYSPTAEFGVPCYESQDYGNHFYDYCRMSVNIKFNVGPYPSDYVSEFNYYRNYINKQAPNYVTSSIYHLRLSGGEYKWFLENRQLLHPSSIFESSLFPLDLWIDPSLYWPLFPKTYYFWFMGDDFARNPGCVKIGQGVTVAGDYSSMYYPDPSRPNLVRKSCVVKVDYYTGDGWPNYPGYGCAPIP